MSGLISRIAAGIGRGAEQVGTMALEEQRTKRLADLQNSYRTDAADKAYERGTQASDTAYTRQTERDTVKFGRDQIRDEQEFKRQTQKEEQLQKHRLESQSEGAKDVSEQIDQRASNKETEMYLNNRFKILGEKRSEDSKMRLMDHEKLGAKEMAELRSTLHIMEGKQDLMNKKELSDYNQIKEIYNLNLKQDQWRERSSQEFDQALGRQAAAAGFEQDRLQFIKTLGTTDRRAQLFEKYGKNSGYDAEGESTTSFFGLSGGPPSGGTDSLRRGRDMQDAVSNAGRSEAYRAAQSRQAAQKQEWTRENQATKTADAKSLIDYEAASRTPKVAEGSMSESLGSKVIREQRATGKSKLDILKRMTNDPNITPGERRKATRTLNNILQSQNN